MREVVEVKNVNYVTGQVCLVGCPDIVNVVGTL